MKNFKEYSEDIKIPIKVGDTVLGGKFKNKKIKVKDIGKNEKGDITINGRPLLKFRIMSEAEDLAKNILVEDMKWQQSLSTKLFDVGQGSSIGFEAFWVPLSPSIMNRIWPKEVRATVFHVTDIAGYRKIKKMQGGKRSISSFFEMRGSYFEQGIQTHGGIVIELDANILGAFNQDVMSAPDSGGRRWIQLSFMKGRFGEKDLSKYSKGLQDLVGRLLKKYLPQAYEVAPTSQEPPKIMQKGRYYIHWMNLGIFAAQQKGKKTILQNVIKEYMDGVEDIYKKNANHLRTLLTNYLNLRRSEESWDEIIVNNFKIKKVWALAYSKTWGDPESRFAKDLAAAVGQGSGESEEKSELETFMDEVKTDGFEVEDTDNMDLEMHTRSVARKEAGDAAMKSNPADDLAKRQAEVLKAIGKK